MLEYRQRVVDALNHDDRSIREFALDYFAASFGPDPTLFDRVLATIDRDSWAGAFGDLGRLGRLAHSPRSVSRLLDDIRRGDETRVLLEYMVDAVMTAPAELLEPYAHEPTSDDGLPPEVTDLLAHRVELSRKSPDEIWNLMMAYCEEHLSNQSAGIAHDVFRRANLFVWSLAPHRESLTKRIRNQLSSLPDRTATWEDALATWAAGITVDRSLTPLLLSLYEFADDELYNDLSDALVRIGSPDLLERVEALWPGASWNARFSYRRILEGCPTEASAKLALRFAAEELEREEHKSLTGEFYKAALSILSPAAIEPAKRYALQTEWEFGTSVELLDSLVAACHLLNVPFPEKDELRERNEREFSTLRKKFADITKMFESASLPAPVARPAPTYPKEHPFLRTDSTVGRNDPCPCRSGKKFKKCCANKVKG